MGDSGLEPALEASWSRLPRPGYGPFNSSSQNPGPSAWELRVRGPTWPRGPGSGEQGSFHKEAPESGALGFASREQRWGLYSPPPFPQPHHLNPPLPDSLISCPRCPPQGQEFCLGPVPPQASGRVSPGLQRPEEGPPNAWVWSTEPPVSLPQALPAPLHTAVCRKSLESPARGPLSTSPQPHPVLGAWPAQDPGAASRPVSMVARSREDPFIPAVGSAVPRSRSFCGQHSVKAQRSVDSLCRKPARSRPVGPLAPRGTPGQLPGQTGPQAHVTCSFSGSCASVSGPSPPARPRPGPPHAYLVCLRGMSWPRQTLSNCPRRFTTKKTVQIIPHVLCALPRPLLSPVRADPSAVQQEVAAGPLHHHPAVGAPSLACVHPVAACFLPEEHLLQALPGLSQPPGHQRPFLGPGTGLVSAWPLPLL